MMLSQAMPPEIAFVEPLYMNLCCLARGRIQMAYGGKQMGRQGYVMGRQGEHKASPLQTQWPGCFYGASRTLLVQSRAM